MPRRRILKRAPVVYILMQLRVAPILAMAKYVPDIQDALRRSGFRSQRIVERLVDALDSLLQPLEIEPQIMRHRKLALARFNIGDRREPVFEIGIEPVLRLARLQIEEAENK